MSQGSKTLSAPKLKALQVCPLHGVLHSCTFLLLPYVCIISLSWHVVLEIKSSSYLASLHRTTNRLLGGEENTQPGLCSTVFVWSSRSTMSPSSSLTQVHQPRGSGSGGTPSFNKSARLLRPTTLPIPVLSSSSSSVAKRYAVAHTLAVPLYYYLRASALVADPLPTLITDLIVVGAAQAIFCALCLPSAGTWVSGTTGGKIIEGTATTTTSTTTKTSKGSSAAGGSMRKKGGHGGGGGGGGKISTSKGGFGDGGAAGGNISSRIMVSTPPFPASWTRKLDYHSPCSGSIITANRFCLFPSQLYSP